MSLEPGMSATLTISYKEEGKYYLVLTTTAAENLDDDLL